MAMSVLAFPKQYPFATNMIIASGKTSVADLIVQCAVEKKKLEEVNWTRNAAFVAFGFAYLGGFQYWLQVNMFRKMFVGMDKVAEMPLSDLRVLKRRGAFTLLM